MTESLLALENQSAARLEAMVMTNRRDAEVIAGLRAQLADARRQAVEAMERLVLSKPDGATALLVAEDLVGELRALLAVEEKSDG